MAKGNWRNWDEINCSGCGQRMYAKGAKRLGGQKYCPSCFEKATNKTIIKSIDDLPDYVKKYARMWKNNPKDIIVVFPMPTELTEADAKAIPIAIKFIKAHGGGYDDRGSWYIPLSESNQGWHEAGQLTVEGKIKAPEHVKAAQQSSLSDVLRQPLVPRQDSNLFEEAKRYKTPEEFIKAQGEPMYHGTSKQFTEFDVNLIGATQGFKESGFHFTDNKESARHYSSMYPQKPKYAWTETDKLAAQNTIVVEAYFPKDEFITLMDLIELYKSGAIKTKPVIEGLFRPESVVDNNREAVREALNITGKKVFKAKREGQTNYLVSDVSIIKTKDQLIKVWNEVHGK